MLFCKNCGASLSEQAQFCKKCGTEVKNSNLEKTTASRISSSKKWSKKQIWWVSSICAVILLLFAGYKTGEALTSKDSLIDRFEEALTERNGKKIADLLSSNHNNLEINEKSIQPFVKYLEANPKAEADIISLLKNQAQSFEEAKNQNLFGITEGGFLSLVKDGKTLFYDNYKIHIEPVFLTIGTNYQGTDLIVNGEKIDTSTEQDFTKEYGPYIPGIYEVEAALQSDFVKLEKKENETLISANENFFVDMALDGQQVTLNWTADQEDLNGKLYINGKDVNKDPYAEPSFGPVLTDGSMNLSVETEFPWGKIKTDDITINEEYLPINPIASKAFLEEITQTIFTGTNETMKALADGNVDAISTGSADYKSRIRETTDNMKEFGESYKGSFLSAEYDLDSPYLEKDENGQWILNMSGQETHNASSYYEGNDPVLEESTEEYDYKLRYDKQNSKWLLEDRSTTFFSFSKNYENTIEKKNENPIEYTSAWAGTN